MVCGVVPQPESCGTDSGTGEIRVFARFSILLYQCTKVPSKYKGGLASPLTPSSQLHNLQPIPPSPLWYGGTWYSTRPPAPHSSHAPSSADTPFSPLVQRYAVQDSCPPPPRRVIYPIAAPIPSPCPGTAVHGTALGHERDRRTAKHGKGEASRHGALQPRTATACAIKPAKMIPTSLGATSRAFALPTFRPSHSKHNRTDLP